MNKVLIGKKNTTWGVIINPVASDTFRHILSFDNKAKKLEFISHDVFEGADVMNLLNQQKKKSIVFDSSTEATFSVHPKDYPNEDMVTLLNKDFAIVQKDDDLLFYAIAGKRNGQLVEYTAKLDIFMTYDINDIFDDETTAEISRAMYDRYSPNDPGIKNLIHINTSNDFDTPLYSKEPLNIDDTVLMYEDEPEILKGDFTDRITNHQTLTADEIDLINTRLAEIIWNVTYYDPKNNPLDLDGVSEKDQRLLSFPNTQGTYTELPFGALLTIGSIPTDVDLVPWDGSTNSELTTVDFFRWSGKITGNPSVLKNGYKPISANILYDFKNSVIIEYDKQNNLQPIKVKFVIPDQGDAISTNGSYKSVTTKANIVGTTKKGLGIRVISPPNTPTVLRTHKTIPMDPKSMPLTKIPKANRIGLLRNIDNEVKLRTHPFTELRVFSSSPNAKVLEPQLFAYPASKNPMQVWTWQAYQVDLNGYSAAPNGYILERAINGSTQPPVTFDDYTAYEYTGTIDNYAEYAIRNKSSQNARLLETEVSAGSGGLALAAGIAFAPATGGASLALAGLGAGLSIAQTATKINAVKAQWRDAKRTPNEIIGTGSNYEAQAALRIFKPHIAKLSVYGTLKKMIFDFFYKYGYNYSDTIQQIRPLIKSRYYFNYLQIPETFENIKIGLSSEIKQVINDSIAKGITIWHYRDQQTFKGIKNYAYENVEMSII